MFDQGVSATVKAKKNSDKKAPATKKVTALNLKKNSITQTIVKDTKKTATRASARTTRSAKTEVVQSKKSSSKAKSAVVELP
jgi:acetyl-CoA carboxylase alpha subunit